MPCAHANMDTYMLEASEIAVGSFSHRHGGDRGWGLGFEIGTLTLRVDRPADLLLNPNTDLFITISITNINI